MKTYLFSIAKVPSKSFLEETSGFELDSFYQCKANYDIPELVGIPVNECELHPVHMVESYKEDSQVAAMMLMRQRFANAPISGVFFMKSEEDLTREDIEAYLTNQTTEWLKDFFGNREDKLCG